MDQRTGRTKMALAKGMGLLWPGQSADNQNRITALTETRVQFAVPPELWNPT
jgi:hypothetical protein